jgi:type IV secretion system protein VirB6
VFLTATIASYVSVRLIAGLLLAIGPVFIAFLMFDGTRSLFEGWMRALVAAVVGALAVTMMLGIELALLEPWLADLLARRHAGLSTAANSTELLVVGLAFAIALVAAMGMAARLALAFRLPFARQRDMRDTSHIRDGLSPSDILSQHRSAMLGDEPSRAVAVAEAVAAAQRREARGVIERGAPAAALLPQSQPGRIATAPDAVPLGQSYRRRAQNRFSASAGKRDIGS